MMTVRVHVCAPLALAVRVLWLSVMSIILRPLLPPAVDPAGWPTIASPSSRDMSARINRSVRLVPLFVLAVILLSTRLVTHWLVQGNSVRAVTNLHGDRERGDVGSCLLLYSGVD